jgi:hypothetical protein
MSARLGSTRRVLAAIRAREYVAPHVEVTAQASPSRHVVRRAVSVPSTTLTSTGGGWVTPQNGPSPRKMPTSAERRRSTASGCDRVVSIGCRIYFGRGLDACAWPELASCGDRASFLRREGPPDSDSTIATGPNRRNRLRGAPSAGWGWEEHPKPSGCAGFRLEPGSL